MGNVNVNNRKVVTISTSSRENGRRVWYLDQSRHTEQSIRRELQGMGTSENDIQKAVRKVHTVTLTREQPVTIFRNSLIELRVVI